MRSLLLYFSQSRLKSALNMSNHWVENNI